VVEKGPSKSAPNFSLSAYELFSAALAAHDIRTAQEALEAIRQAEGPTEGWVTQLCRLSEAIGQDPEVAIRGVLQSYPYAIGPHLLLSRMLLTRGDINGAMPHLFELERLGNPEGAYSLGMVHMQNLNLWGALVHFAKAAELNPAHEPSQQHLAELRRVIAEQVPAKIELDSKALLTGPHSGTLAKAKIRCSVVICHLQLSLDDSGMPHFSTENTRN